METVVMRSDFIKELKKNDRIVYDLQLQEKSEIIYSLTVYIEEAQSQYNECFSEVRYN